ncbi:GntR family transcriptional regulator [Candidimonas sp. SYP-B2681]|uniref:GntR family transcriptional regulator n=1 Tax=Candidimonas sp. SYP-B2681 TaxID=2497686 RepID=UPI000F8615B5|nr:GntR family transcriptional regulator [Candidimonas sp. SYP-B2681]RTZ38873.1 GntR family transcriptional regulator [Candidimonas sp. SYP-B2681]
MKSNDTAVTTDIALARDTLHQRVAARLRELLTHEVLGAGAKLNERELCESLGVSRTPLREAIRLLAAEGLVTLEPGRGAFVPVLSDEDIAHTFDLLSALEGLAGELAARRISDSELTELRALQLEMSAAFERRDLPAYYRFNIRIHDLISQAAGNPVLRETWSQVNSRMQALRFRSNQDEAKWARALEEHAQILVAMQNHDSEMARHLLSTHLIRKRDSVLELRQKTRAGSA